VRVWEKKVPKEALVAGMYGRFGGLLLEGLFFESEKELVTV